MKALRRLDRAVVSSQSDRPSVVHVRGMHRTGFASTPGTGPLRPPDKPHQRADTARGGLDAGVLSVPPAFRVRRFPCRCWLGFRRSETSSSPGLFVLSFGRYSSPRGDANADGANQPISEVANRSGNPGHASNMDRRSGRQHRGTEPGSCRRAQPARAALSVKKVEAALCALFI